MLFSIFFVLSPVTEYLSLFYQAQARCHRIGQSKSVKIYRLITRNSYEREMFDKASLKLGLDKAVLQSMSGRENATNGVRINTLRCMINKCYEHVTFFLLVCVLAGERWFSDGVWHVF